MSAAGGKVEGAEQGVAGPCWRPDSWRDKSSAHQPAYDDAHALAAALAALSVLPPLVTSGEVDHLRDLFADAQSGRRFILQGGECAETFADCVPSVITNRLKVLLQMSLILEHGLGKPVVRVGRFAGQYAKPRTVETETIGGETLPVYRGDLVNGAEFTARAPTRSPAFARRSRAFGDDAEFRPRARRRRLRRPASSGVLEPGLGVALSTRERVPPSR